MKGHDSERRGGRLKACVAARVELRCGLLWTTARARF